jgi:hypothetical protein
LICNSAKTNKVRWGPCGNFSIFSNGFENSKALANHDDGDRAKAVA